MNEIVILVPGEPLSVWYLLNGDSLWQNRWEATDHDLVLMLLTVAGSLYLSWTMLRYCWRLTLAIPLATSTGVQNALRAQRRSHLGLLSLCVAHGIFLWIWPIYFVLAALFWIAAMVHQSLNQIPLHVLAACELTSGDSCPSAKDRTCEEHLIAVAESLDNRQSTSMTGPEGSQALREMAHEMRSTVRGH